MLTGLYAKLIMAAAIAAACLGAWLYVHHLQSTIVDLRAENSTLVAQGNILSQKIVEQNNAVDAMAKAADAKEKAAAVAVAAAKAETTKAKAKATTIFKATPSTPGNSCKSALDLVNGGAK